MNAGAHALDANEHALAEAIAWLRERLAHAAGAEPVPARPLASSDPDSVPTLRLLRRHLGLGVFECHVLLLCVGVALDTRIAALCAAVHGDTRRAFPTFALALAIFDDAHWDALSPHRPLRAWRLVEAIPDGAAPLSACPLRADDRIVDYVKGLNELDERVGRVLVALDGGDDDSDGDPLPASQQAIVDRAHDFMSATQARGGVPTLQLAGIDAASKRLVASRVCERAGLRPCRVGLAALPAAAAELDAWCRLWRRECRLLPLALYIDALDLPAGETGDSAGAAIERVLDRLQAPAFVDTRDAGAIGAGERDGLLVLPVGKPSGDEQQREWARLLGMQDDAAARLASQFDLNLPQIRRLAHQAGEARFDAIWNACRAHAQPRLDQLAQRVDARAVWDDIVLPEEALSQLRQLVAQAALRRRVHGDWGFERRTRRGLGLSALFHGESGTGKTMAAEVIANALGLDLYRVDLSAVISKYIGETEKNLQRIFDAAESGGSVLFFDEADALFGKRSEVRDSHDRYANIETNYLLQRIESFGGVAILASNLRGSLDSAFMRRLRFIVSFAFPGARERAAMWRKAFPQETPVEALDVVRLARLDCTGASIHNIALNAAFMAAQRGTSVTMRNVLDAARAELLKLGRSINESDFRLATAGGAGA